MLLVIDFKFHLFRFFKGLNHFTTHPKKRDLISDLYMDYCRVDLRPTHVKWYEAFGSAKIT